MAFRIIKVFYCIIVLDGWIIQLVQLAAGAVTWLKIHMCHFPIWVRLSMAQAPIGMHTKCIFISAAYYYDHYDTMGWSTVLQAECSNKLCRTKTCTLICAGDVLCAGHVGIKSHNVEMTSPLSVEQLEFRQWPATAAGFHPQCIFNLEFEVIKN